MNGADISRAIMMGHHPGLDPTGFAEVVRKMEAERRRESDEMRVRGVTKIRGYRLGGEWADAADMLRETGFDAPAWLGGGVSVERWAREGSDPIFVFRPRVGAGDLMAFWRRGGRRWCRIF